MNEIGGCLHALCSEFPEVGIAAPNIIVPKPSAETCRPDDPKKFIFNVVVNLRSNKDQVVGKRVSE
ncbi:hypothetical protein CJ179_47050 [Rhodococcus sp. ACS1]|nr:hypothetical protein CJ179_47050 [Rhodococcus sp. ACS1]